MNAIAHDRVAAQRRRGRGMQRHEPGFARLALDDAEDAHLQVHVLTREGQRLTDPQPVEARSPNKVPHVWGRIRRRSVRAARKSAATSSGE